MKLKQTTDGWLFTGRVPMELARKVWPDRYGAIQAAERIGFAVMTKGSVVDDRCNDPDAEVNRSSSDDFDW